MQNRFCELSLSFVKTDKFIQKSQIIGYTFRFFLLLLLCFVFVLCFYCLEVQYATNQTHSPSWSLIEAVRVQLKEIKLIQSALRLSKRTTKTTEKKFAIVVLAVWLWLQTDYKVSGVHEAIARAFKTLRQ